MDIEEGTNKEESCKDVEDYFDSDTTTRFLHGTDHDSHNDHRQEVEEEVCQEIVVDEIASADPPQITNNILHCFSLEERLTVIALY